MSIVAARDVRRAFGLVEIVSDLERIGGGRQGVPQESGKFDLHKGRSS